MNIDCTAVRVLALASLVLGGCASTAARDAPATTQPSVSMAAVTRAEAPADAFLAALATHCGQAFAGRVVVDTPASAQPDAFAGKPLVMHVRGCEDPTRELRIPFHVGDDRSRTWVITRTAQGLQLKHDHRHADGSEDVLTMYGGGTIRAGSAQRQEFPVDAESIALFERQSSLSSVTNTWALEIDSRREFVYELSRPGGRQFRVAFDLRTPVASPRAPWGARD